MSKEHSYAYEAGYRDGAINYELDHCPACKNVADLQEALVDNAKLREQLAKARDPQRIGGTADPESFVYAIEQLREFRWQHATNDEEAIPYINNVADAHERENAKLRELCATVIDDWMSKVCPSFPFCEYGGEYQDCTDETCGNQIYRQMARELGVEVEG